MDHGARQSRDLQPRGPGLFPPARPDAGARELGPGEFGARRPGLHRPDSAIHRHGRGPVLHRARFERCRRRLSVRRRPLRGAVREHAAQARQLASHASADLGLPLAPQDHQRQPATGAGGLERQASRRLRAGACRPYPRRRGTRIQGRPLAAIRARHRRHAAHGQDQGRSERQEDRRHARQLRPVRPPLRLCDDGARAAGAARRLPRQQ